MVNQTQISLLLSTTAALTGDALPFLEQRIGFSHATSTATHRAAALSDSFL
jgi:hypothetical protein